jgi:DNA-binding response OmpR family regulator
MARILIADDDELVGEIVCNALSDAGHIPGFLTNGRDALDVIRQRTPDLVILDCNMPGISGLLLLRELRQQPELFDIPVLMLTGRTSANDEALAHFEGADAYVRKPFDPDQLVVEVEALLTRKKMRAPSLKAAPLFARPSICRTNEGEGPPSARGRS